MKIEVPRDAPTGTYSLPVEVKYNQSRVHGGSVEPRNLTLVVQNALTPVEAFKGFWEIFGQPISIIVGGFAGGMASLVFDRIKKPRRA